MHSRRSWDKLSSKWAGSYELVRADKRPATAAAWSDAVAARDRWGAGRLRGPPPPLVSDRSVTVPAASSESRRCKQLAMGSRATLWAAALLLLAVACPRGVVAQISAQPSARPADPYFDGRPIQVCTSEYEPVMRCIDRDPSQYSG